MLELTLLRTLRVLGGRVQVGLSHPRFVAALFCSTISVAEIHCSTGTKPLLLLGGILGFLPPTPVLLPGRGLI